MTRISRIATILLAGASLPMLAACGADDIASPGSTPNGPITIDIGGGTGGSGGSGGQASVAAASCPNITGADKLTDKGVIGDGVNNWRNCQLPAKFNSDTTLPALAGVLYSIDGRVEVGTDQGAASTNFDVDLTIEPGVVIFAVPNKASHLAVNRGNQIHAVGTATKPIIFTSESNVRGLANDTTSAQWGGVVLLGRARIADCIDAGAAPGTVACERETEGTTGLRYGGANDADDSGEFQYVQIRYSGFELSAGRELQGLTPSGVGSGTVISNIQVHNSSDDGIEAFGGNFNMKYLVLTGNEDDNLDTDVGYRGAVQYMISVQRHTGLATQGDTFLETDSDVNASRPGDSSPRTNLKISNFTHVQRFNGGEDVAVMMLRGGADATLVNGIILQDIRSTGGARTTDSNGVNQGGIAITGTALLPCLQIRDPQTLQTSGPAQEAGRPVYRSVFMQCPQGTGGAANPFSAGRNTGLNPGTGSNWTDLEIQAIFTAGSTANSFNYAPTLTNFILPGAKEEALTAVDPSTIDPSFNPSSYVGAVQGASDNWYRGWTCNSDTITLSTTNGRCTAIPAIA